MLIQHGVLPLSILTDIFHVVFNGFKALHAQVMFNLARILRSYLGIHPQTGQPSGEQLMPLIDARGDLVSGVCQVEKAVIIRFPEAGSWPG